MEAVALMRMRSRLLGVGLVGLVLPFLARLPGCVTQGSQWLRQYLGSGLSAFLFLEAFNLIALGGALVAAFVVRQRGLWMLPVVAGYAYVAYGHGTLDLKSDAQAAIGLIFIPIYSLPYFAGGGLLAAAVWLAFIRPKGSRSLRRV